MANPVARRVRPYDGAFIHAAMQAHFSRIISASGKPWHSTIDLAAVYHHLMTSPDVMIVDEDFLVYAVTHFPCFSPPTSVVSEQLILRIRHTDAEFSCVVDALKGLAVATNSKYVACTTGLGTGAGLDKLFERHGFYPAAGQWALEL